MKRYSPIDAELFIQNRKRFVSKLKPNSVVIFHSNDEMPQQGDQKFPFRQNSDLFYLSGIDQEDSILVIFPDSPKPEYKEILFLKKTTEQIAVWEGHKYNEKEAQQVSAIKTIYWIDEFETHFSHIMKHVKNCYINLNENDRFSSPVQYNELRFVHELKSKYPLHNYDRAAPILAELRAVKSDIEINLIKHACNITHKGVDRVLKFTKPGVKEYEIEAEITHEFINNCAQHAYTPIIASGKNACVLHYINNTEVCKDGDIILLDFGASYANYASDLTRSIPVNGKFTKRQKDVYNAVLRVMKAATKMLMPGTLLDKYHEEVGKIMEEEFIGLGLLKKSEVQKQDPQKPLYKKYFMHGTSHFLGLDVHDIGDRYKPMQAGMIFTCEPGIYIPEESIGIRLENDILLTEKGPVDLMQKIPIEADEIEELMVKNKKKW